MTSIEISYCVIVWGGAKSKAGQLAERERVREAEAIGPMICVL